MDPIGSCLRERCECDLQLAKKLSEHEEDWNVENHRRWGDNPFNAEERCRAPHHKTTTQAYIAPSTVAPVIVTTQEVTTSKYKKTKETVQHLRMHLNGVKINSVGNGSPSWKMNITGALFMSIFKLNL